MKKLILTLIFVLPLLMQAQKEPTPWEFKWGHSNDLRTFNLDSFQQNSFLTGFQWSGTVDMNNAMENICLYFSLFNAIV